MKPLLALSIVLVPGLVFGQDGLNPSQIFQSLADQWPTYSGDYTGKRYSGLKLINQSTVRNLSLSWVTRFTTGCGPTGAGTGAAGGFGGGFGGRGGGGAPAPII
ncbi:MAG TPA: acido-empty-quinoprotein group A, partial [Candidatus Sulfopaludibacter sp.]|nr:acido-empty-quinoprotein group A [Candidatus Sulfopaludibacter sp.]